MFKPWRPCVRSSFTEFHANPTNCLCAGTKFQTDRWMDGRPLSSHTGYFLLPKWALKVFEESLDSKEFCFTSVSSEGQISDCAAQVCSFCKHAQWHCHCEQCTEHYSRSGWHENFMSDYLTSTHIASDLEHLASTVQAQQLLYVYT